MRLRDLPDELNALSSRVLEAAIRVHRALGPGLLERHYRDALAIELREMGHEAEAEFPIPVRYRGHDLGWPMRADLVIDRAVLVELKCVEALAPVHWKQVECYLAASGLPLGLLVNFEAPHLGGQIKRIVPRSVAE